MSSFAALRTILREWPSGPTAGSLPELPYERLRAALTNAAGPADLACLIRHALRREALFYENPSVRLVVPARPPFPARQQWLDHGCTARAVGDGFFEVEATAWSQSWLKPVYVRGELSDPFEGVWKDRPRSLVNRRVPSDPSLRSHFRLQEYLSSAQAETIRSVLLSPPGSVRVVVLPTGGGKSLVGLSAALLGTSDLGLSLFIVPTIALAHDQVESAKKFCPDDAIDAWESGLSTEDREAVRVRIRSGAQRLLFIAPEALVGGLARDLMELAEKGLLRTFVVDEAHLVGQWGSSFRPEYQAMSAFWRYLVGLCPPERSFRTLLMTATLTPGTFDDLSNFFGPLGPEHTLATVQLRQEPDYFQAACASRDDQVARIVELLRHGPRPAILYVTTKDDARWWHALCLSIGWRRTGIVHGETASGDRERAVLAWRDNQLDLMVATSAFGLGMDKGDVRLVVHACVPETVDRYYQEVGRGGRDGHPCVSAMIWTHEDRRRGYGMSHAMIVGEEIGLKRWREMWMSGQRIGADTFLINLGKVRSGLNWESQDNVEWNLRTLLLLARAKVLRLRYRPIPPLEQLATETDEAYAERRSVYVAEQATLRPIELLEKNNPLTEEAWSALVEPDRAESRQESQLNWRRMSEILDGGRPLPEVLAEVYAVPRAGIHAVGVDHTDVVSTAPMVLPYAISPILLTAVGGQTHVPIVTYRGGDPRGQGQLLVDLMLRLASLGIREFGLPPGWASAPKWFHGVNNPLNKLVARSPERFIIVREIGEAEPFLDGFIPVPRVTLLGPDYASRALPSDLLTLNRPLHLILVPGETLDSEHLGRTVESGPHLRLEAFHSLLQQ
jgi:ATP-dependent DNA helicase RecQ